LACCGLVWFINNQIRTHLNVENISSYLKMDQRMLSWVKLIFSTLIEVCFFGFAASIGEFIGLPWFTFAIPAAMILAWLSYPLALKMMFIRWDTNGWLIPCRLFMLIKINCVYGLAAKNANNPMKPVF
jgi:hypothetical protein